MDAYLRALERHLPHALVPVRSLEQIRRVTRRLPFGLTDCFGFECPLGEGALGADFLVAVRRRQAGALVDLHPGWDPISDLARAWLDPRGELHEAVDNVWLEFDTERLPADGAIPPPNTFVGTSRVPGDDGLAPTWLTEQALPLLRHEPLDAAEANVLQACVERLPASARVFQIGSMLARGRAGTRLCVNWIEAARIPGYLREIAWPGDGELGVLEEIAPLVDAVDLDFDVAAEVQPKIGLELYFQPRAQRQHETRIAELLSRLVSLGLCMETKREALDAYPGADARTGGEFPAPLKEMSRILGGRAIGIIRRGLHHVKLVVEPGRPLSAKAYLEVHLDWYVRGEAGWSLVRTAP